MIKRGMLVGYPSKYLGLRTLLKSYEETKTQPGIFTAPLEADAEKNSETTKSKLFYYS